MDEPLASLPPSTPYQKTLSLFWARPHHHRHTFHHIYLVVVALLPRLRSQDRTSGVNFSSGCKVNIVTSIITDAGLHIIMELSLGFPAVPWCASLPQVYPREAVAMRKKYSNPHICATHQTITVVRQMRCLILERKKALHLEAVL